MKLSTIKEMSITSICLIVVFIVVFFTILNSTKNMNHSLLAAFIVSIMSLVPIYAASI